MQGFLKIKFYAEKSMMNKISSFFKKSTWGWEAAGAEDPHLRGRAGLSSEWDRGEAPLRERGRSLTSLFCSKLSLNSPSTSIYSLASQLASLPSPIL